MSSASVKNRPDEEFQEGIEDGVDLPYVVEDVTLMSPGTWNNTHFTGDVIEDALEMTDWSDEARNDYIYWEHDDHDSRDFVGRTRNLRVNETGELVGDLEIVDMEAAVKLAYGARFGISPKITADTVGRDVRSFTIDNFSVVLDPAIKTTFLNRDFFTDEDGKDISEMSDVPEPEFDEMVAERLAGFYGRSKSEFLDVLEAAKEGSVEASDEKDSDTMTENEEVDEQQAQEELSEEEAAEAEAAEAEAEAADEELSEEEAEDVEEDTQEMADLEEMKDELVQAVLDEIENAHGDRRYPYPQPQENSDQEDEPAVEDIDEFSEFAAERREENPDLELSEIVDEWNEAQKDPEDKMEEFKQELSSQINDLKEQLEAKDQKIQEFEEKVNDPVRATADAGRSRREEVKEFSTEDKDKAFGLKLLGDYGVDPREYR